jgi:hypothetical protein
MYLMILTCYKFVFLRWPGRNYSPKSLENSSGHSGDGELSWNDYVWQLGKAVQAGFLPGVGRHSAQDMSISSRAGGECIELHAGSWKVRNLTTVASSIISVIYLPFRKEGLRKLICSKREWQGDHEVPFLWVPSCSEISSLWKMRWHDEDFSLLMNEPSLTKATDSWPLV